MAKRLGLTDIRSLPPNTTIWDGTVKGFGARRQSGDTVSFILMYRTLEGRQRLLTIGKAGSPFTPDTARDRAVQLLSQVVAGGDPAADKKARRSAMTVAQLCGEYLKDAEEGRLLIGRGRTKKASTLKSDKGRIEAHIVPLLGKLSVASVTSADVEGMMHAIISGKTAKQLKHTSITGGSGAARRVVGLFGAVMTYSVKRRLRLDNPVRGVIRPAGGHRERRLSDTEYADLGSALTRLSGTMLPAQLAAVRFLALTGFRSGEVVGLEWANVDLERRICTLPDSKTGRSVRPLSEAACDVVRSLGGVDGLVFPGRSGKIAFRKVWLRLGMPADITPHTLRHSHASLAADLGYSELTISMLLGHRNGSVTSKYTHFADAVLLAAADVSGGENPRINGASSFHI